MLKRYYYLVTSLSGESLCDLARHKVNYSSSVGGAVSNTTYGSVYLLFVVPERICVTKLGCDYSQQITDI